MKKSFTTLLLGLFVVAFLAMPAAAQNLRPDDTGFFKVRVGLSNYFGDNERTPVDFDFDMFAMDDKLPYALGAELGYNFTPRYSWSIGYNYGNYPTINQFSDVLEESDPLGNSTINESPTSRHTIQLLGRYLLSDGRVAPYIHAGGNVTIGNTWYEENNAIVTDGNDNAEESRIGFGPSLGLGLDFVLNRRTSFFAEYTANATFSDDKVDGSEDEFAPFDLVNQLHFGLKINFKEACTPVMVTDLSGPMTLVEGEAGTFTASINGEASTPVSYEWDLGDGTSAMGPSVTHTFDDAGSYTVTASALNCGGTTSRSMTVDVASACVPAEIVTMTANPTDPDTRTAVAFSANVRGTAPVDYSWDFGDGTTGTGATPTHTYPTAGTYTVTLTVENCGGTVERTMTIVVGDYIAEICREVTELNSTFFDRNSSTLSAEARQRLGENLEILNECPNICVRIEGLAAPGERNAQGLSEDRARAVEQYYMDNGVIGSRMNALGLGRVEGVTSKKSGTAQYRRADSIPMQCTDMDMGDM